MKSEIYIAVDEALGTMAIDIDAYMEPRFYPLDPVEKDKLEEELGQLLESELVGERMGDRAENRLVSLALNFFQDQVAKGRLRELPTGIP